MKIINNNSHEEWIDYIKFISIMLVILCHSGIGGETVSIRVTYGLCVPPFILLNGYLMLRKQRCINTMILKAIKCLFLFLFWGIISSILFNVLSPQPVNFIDVIIRALKMQYPYSNTLWFINLMAFLYLINPLLKPVVEKRDNLCKYMLILLFVFSVCGLRELMCYINFFKSDKFSMVFYYCAGYFLFSINDETIKRYRCLLFVVFVISVILNALVPTLYKGSVHFIWQNTTQAYSSPFIVLASICMCVIIKTLKLKYNVIVFWVAKNSLGFYLLHYFFVNIFHESNYIPHPFLRFVMGTIGASFMVYLLNSNKYTKKLINI